MTIESLVAGAQVIPYVGPLALVLFGAAHAQEDAANAHHHRQVVFHIMRELGLRDVFDRVDRVDHHLGDAQLLVDAREHDLLVDALVFAPDEIPVHVGVKVVQGAHMRKGHVDEDVVDVEAVLGQLEPAILQELGAIDDRMHEQVLALTEMAYLVPRELLAHREHVAVVHHDACVLVHLFVHVVSHDQVGGVFTLDLPTQVVHHAQHGHIVEPIVGIDHFEVQAGCFGEAVVDRAAMTAVLLVDSANDPGVPGFPLVGLLARIVLLRTVVDKDDLDVVAAAKQRFDALVHIGRRIVARDGERDGLHVQNPSSRCDSRPKSAASSIVQTAPAPFGYHHTNRTI